VLAKLKALLRALNTEARILVTTESKVEPDLVMGTGLFSMERAENAPGWLKVCSCAC
jgi:G3E family GTPase